MKHSSLLLLIAAIVLCVSVDAVVRRSGCVLQKVLGHPNRFTVHKSLLPGENRNRKFYCSNGTVFDEDLCTCVRNQDPYFQATAPPITQSPYATDSSVSPLMSTERPCVFAPALDKRYYMQRRSFGSGWFRRPCPYGLLFNETLCLCTDPAPIAISSCRPDVYLRFDKGQRNDSKDTQEKRRGDMRPDIIYDSSGQGLHIDNNRVNIVEDSAQFDRRGRLDIPYYANNYFGDKITVTFRFFDFPGGDTEQVLMSNCHASGKYGSIEIALRPSTDEVLFRIDTTISGMNEIAVPYQKKAWNNVRMTYDGQYLRGQVNSEENREMVRGYIQNRDRGVSIGQCGIRRRETKRAYVGYIDEFRVYKCIENGDYNMP